MLLTKFWAVTTFLIVPVGLGHQGEVDTSAVGAVLLVLKFHCHLIQNIFLSLPVALSDLRSLTPKQRERKNRYNLSNLYENNYLNVIDPTSRSIKKQ